MQKNLVRIGAFTVSAMMMASMFAAPVFAAGEEVTDITAVGGLMVAGTGDGSSASVASHTYNVYQVMKKQAIGKDADNKDIYQYKLTPAFEGFTSDNFAIDAQNGAITTKAITFEGTEYPAGTKLNSDQNSDGNANVNHTLASLLARELQMYAVSKNIAPTASLQGGKNTEVVQGWYLVFEAKNESDAAEGAVNDGLIATKPVLLNVGTGDNSVTVKDAKVELDKTIENGHANKEQGDYSIGDKVQYQIATNFPIYANNVDPTSVTFKIEDTQSAGLTVAKSDIKVLVDGTDVTANEGDSTFSISQDGQKFTVDFKGAYVLNKDNEGKSVVVTYEATVNDKAKVDTTVGNGNDNKAVLTFTSNPGVVNENDTLEDECEVFSYAIDFHKLDGAHGTLLSGAKFNLKKGDDTISLIKDTEKSSDSLEVYRPALAGETGITEFETAGKEIRFYGFDAGAYSLVETAAPAGYSKLADPLTFTITATEAEDALTGSATVEGNSLIHMENTTITATDNGGDTTVDMKVNNYQGVSLPSTGAMTSLYIMGAGAAVVLGGGAIVFARRKKDEDED